jgi:DNA-binding LacI/PurR family transcriptional regulator
MARYASSTDVARLAGVSQSSVSRSYRPHASVSKRTREKLPAEDVLVAGFDDIPMAGWGGYELTTFV